MILDAQLLHSLTKGNAEDAWRDIINKTVEITSKTLTIARIPGDVIKRDLEIGELDHFLASIAWDLWQVFEHSVEHTSDRLARWWSEPFSAKGVLILDGLSLRELPWILQGAKRHGFTVHEFTATASELPGETNTFARALGLGSRSQLQNNNGGSSHKLQPAYTESTNMPWIDCANLINGTPNWVFWHHWPDSALHDTGGAGQGLDTLVRNSAEQLSSDDFWIFVDRLALGRRLIITSDHGYAATGYFSDAEGDVGQFLKQTFGGGRSVSGTRQIGPFVPPVALQVNNIHGIHLLALGRRKWRSQGGYPTLTHGGFSLLEVLSPFVELTKSGSR